MSRKDLLVFDMDGVLVDVTDSYRETIRRTVEHFTGRPLAAERIQDYKNQGGWNDDWALSHRLVQEGGGSAGYQEIVDHFQNIFLGEARGLGTDGLILQERWIAREGLLERLAVRFHLAVFTGRLHWEADLTLDRFAPGVIEMVVGVDEVSCPKPDPEGLLKICDRLPHERVWYVGDTVDDAISARAAGVPFIGIASRQALRRAELVRVLENENAVAVLEDINELEGVLNLA